MESDDDTTEAPPPQYLRRRRRSNTLPSDILRHLKDKYKEKGSKQEPLERASKSKQFLSEDRPRGYPHKKLPPLHGGNGSINSSPFSSNESISSSNSKKANKTRLKSLGHKGESNGYGSIPNINAESYIDGLMRASSVDALNVQRSPLPRGSNLYESLMQEFGHNEEERDTLSPLPSPVPKRRTKFRYNAHAPSHLSADATNSAPGSPSNSRRRVHWSEDIHFNKLNK